VHGRVEQRLARELAVLGPEGRAHRGW
jgi:hypothetical protein